MTLKQIIKNQFEYARTRGWISCFAEAARQFGFTTADLMAVASRESNMKNIKGDYHSGAYHGYSLMQLDINSHRAWIQSGAWQDAEQAIFKGAAALAEKRSQILKASRQVKASVRFRSGKTASFTPRKLDDLALRHCTLAAYNCGMASYYHYSVGNDIDRGTTQKNYGADVMARAALFQKLLDSSPQSVAGKSPSIEDEKTGNANESVAQAGSPAEVSPETDVDLLGAAVKSNKAKAVGLSLGGRIAKHGLAALTFLGAMDTAFKVGAVVVLLVLLAGLAWLVYHNRKRLKSLFTEVLK